MKFVYLQKQMVSILAIALSVLFFWLPSASQGGQAAPLDKTIQHLIAYVAHSDLTFVRNSAEYTGKEASEHIQKKYAHFRDKIATPEDFIELCAFNLIIGLVWNKNWAISFQYVHSNTQL